MYIHIRLYAYMYICIYVCCCFVNYVVSCSTWRRQNPPIQNLLCLRLAISSRPSLGQPSKRSAAQQFKASYEFSAAQLNSSKLHIPWLYIISIMMLILLLLLLPPPPPPPSPPPTLPLPPGATRSRCSSRRPSCWACGGAEKISRALRMID